MERKIDVIDDLDGNKIVVIHDVIFKGKRSMDWADVEEYLKGLMQRQKQMPFRGFQRCY